jgi:hypothetical protein
MPVYQQTYRQYEGTFQSRFRWATIVIQELRVLADARIFRFFIIAALLHCILRLLQVVAFDIVAQDPNHPLKMLQNIAAFDVNEKMFYNFIQIQAPVVFIITLYAGCGMICNDFRNNLMEIYFAKPISWRDYALGKFATLLFIGLAITAVPAVILIVLHNLLLPSTDLVIESLSWMLASIGFSFAVVLPCATATLASSALLASQNFAAITLVSIIIANSVIGGILYETLSHNFGIISLPMAIDELGTHFFGGTRTSFELPWIYPFLFVAGVCIVASLIVVRKVRQAEVAA